MASFRYQSSKILTVPMNFEGRGRSYEMERSVEHYHVEMLSALEGKDFRWDNAAPRQAQGEAHHLFGFVFTAAGEDFIELREILEVMTVDERRPTWDVDVPAQSDRAAIRLSAPIGHISSTELVQSSSNAPSRRANGKMLTMNGTNVYTWDSDLMITPFP